MKKTLKLTFSWPLWRSGSDGQASPAPVPRRPFRAVSLRYQLVDYKMTARAWICAGGSSVRACAQQDPRKSGGRTLTPGAGMSVPGWLRGRGHRLRYHMSACHVLVCCTVGELLLPRPELCPFSTVSMWRRTSSVSASKSGRSSCLMPVGCRLMPATHTEYAHIKMNEMSHAGEEPSLEDINSAHIVHTHIVHTC